MQARMTQEDTNGTPSVSNLRSTLQCNFCFTHQATYPAPWPKEDGFFWASLCWSCGCGDNWLIADFYWTEIGSLMALVLRGLSHTSLELRRTPSVMLSADRSTLVQALRSCLVSASYFTVRLRHDSNVESEIVTGQDLVCSLYKWFFSSVMSYMTNSAPVVNRLNHLCLTCSPVPIYPGGLLCKVRKLQGSLFFFGIKLQCDAVLTELNKW